MDYLKHIEELLEAKMKRQERISPVIFVSKEVFTSILNDMEDRRQHVGYKSSYNIPHHALHLNTYLGQFTVLVNKSYHEYQITNDQ